MLIIFNNFMLIVFHFSINRLSVVSEEGGNIEVNSPGYYPTVCVELSIDCFAVNTVLQVNVDKMYIQACPRCCYSGVS